MDDMYTLFSGFDPIQYNALRSQAIDLYEQCLAQQAIAPLQRFIEGYLVKYPQHIDLLGDVADDLQHRRLGLKEHHFEVRKRILTAIDTIYHRDISHLVPANRLEQYHELDPNDVLDFLRQSGVMVFGQEASILREMIVSSTHTCQRIYSDIFLTDQLIRLLDDWFSAYSLQQARLATHRWTVTQRPDGLTHLQ